VPASLAEGGRVSLLLRPENIHLAGPNRDRDTESLDGTLTDILYFGDTLKLTVGIGSRNLAFRAPPRQLDRLQIGAPVRVSWDRANARVLRAETG
jgi:ABC-type Fe3+/spermidine/putrescine transport system ATPase subunit